MKFPQVQGLLQLAKKVALDHVAYENEARVVKSLKIQTFSPCNEGTIVDRAVKNPNRPGCNVIETISLLKFPQVQGSLQLARMVALDQVAYENTARGIKRSKMLGFGRCNGGTIGDGAVNNPNPRLSRNRNHQRKEISASSRLTSARKKSCTRSSSI